ncbi:MAG: aminoacyl-histidine dipeptidase [Bacteroidales bacterium]|nr:aminoacyl-histidine dipeptidase [Bacteroidales bacterium]MBS3774878.1 aminoacyl-histidine dipeptidase [Bacteroidales bacterium]
MSDITNLDPKPLWENFYKLTQIPRPSKKEASVVKFIEKFGKDLGLETIKDEVGNIIIKKPATKGYENKKPVVLQGHLDMVPQSDKDFDFENQPIEAYVDGEWVTADGTTLGADNGIGVAAALTVLQSDDLEHGPIEALFTVDEETGMTGASSLKPGLLDAEILINMDSEDEGELYIGCAGGLETNARFHFKKETLPRDTNAYKLTVKGLKGGHSGLDIQLQRGNANKVLNRILWYATEKLDVRIAGIESGSLRNAIPREGYAVVVVPNNQFGEFKEYVNDVTESVKNELSRVDTDLKIEVNQTDTPDFVLDKKTQDNMVRALYGCPHGVIRMSDDMEGLVETSTNLAVVKSEEHVVSVQTLQRSSVDSAKEDLGNMIRSVFELGGAEVLHEGEYPGWKPNPDSPILKTMQEVYNKKFGKVPEVKAIHAGLETGIISQAYPHLDMISFGPTISYPHSPGEKVNIETVKKFWDFLVETLKSIPEK